MSEARLAFDSPGPIAPAQRVELLDALRGFALLGILTMNTLALSGFYELNAARAPFQALSH